MCKRVQETTKSNPDRRSRSSRRASTKSRKLFQGDVRMKAAGKWVDSSWLGTSGIQPSEKNMNRALSY